MVDTILESRGQSEAVGVVLLLGIVLLVLGSLGVLGAHGFEDTKADVSIEIAQQELATFAGDVEDVSFGDTPVKTVSLELDTAGSAGTTIVQRDAGWITVSVGDTAVYTGHLGVVEYENQGVYLGYQAGGVWKRSTESSVMIRAPRFSNRNFSTSTLSIPLIRVLGTDGLSDGAVIEDIDVQHPFPTLEVPRDETVSISIESRYYEAWGRYFNESLNIPSEDIEVDEAGQRVTIEYGRDERVYLHLMVYRVEISSR